MAMDHVIRAHGVLAVLAALILRPMQRLNGNRNVHAMALGDHLMRDIGLEPQSDMDRQTHHLRMLAMMVGTHR